MTAHIGGGGRRLPAYVEDGNTKRKKAGGRPFEFGSPLPKRRIEYGKAYFFIGDL